MRRTVSGPIFRPTKFLVVQDRWDHIKSDEQVGVGAAPAYEGWRPSEHCIAAHKSPDSFLYTRILVEHEARKPRTSLPYNFQTEKIKIEQNLTAI